jgi:dienelactone hydrolase
MVICTMLSSGLPAATAATPRVLPIGQLPHDQRLGPLKDLNDYFPFTPCATREAWTRRAAELRRQVLVAAGLWPMPDIKSGSPVIHGKVDREGYTVEKVILETYPGYYLTGSLYRPKGRSGKLPAVLSPHGHWPEGRFYDAGAKEIRRQIVEGAERFELSGRYPLQARCVQLARMGCVVFHYDMVGNADSHQLAHRSGARAPMNDPKRWGFFSPQAEARLQTVFGLQTYNSVRAMDFLSALPDVDPTRIGVTGASGGGTQTLIFCAIDPRPAVSFPAVMVSTAMQGGCPCENACYLRLGSGNIELAALFAPKPLGMTAADDWTKEIATKGLPELKQLYRLFGAEDLVMAKALVHFPHNYNYVSRAVMYHWFNKHLKLGLDEPIVEEDFRPLSVAEMSVWDAEHPEPPRGDEFERAFVERMTEDTRRQIEALRPHDEASLREYRRIVGGAMAAMIGRGLPEGGALRVADGHYQQLGPWAITKFLLRYPAQGEELPVIRLAPKQGNHHVVVWIDRQGKQALFTASGALRPAVQTLLEKGFTVVGADLFGQGEFTADGRPLAKARMNRSKHAAPGESWADYAGFTFGYNPSLFAQRVRDILSLVAFLHHEHDAGDHVDVVGLAGAGHWVAAARAIAGPAIDRAAINTAGFRFANLTKIDDPDFLPGGAKYGDLPGIVALSAPQPLWLAGENDATASPVSAAYRAAGRVENLTVRQGPSEASESAAIAWLVNGNR